MARNHSGQTSPGLREIARADLLYNNSHYTSSSSSSPYPTRRTTNGNSAPHLVPDTYPSHVPPHSSDSYLPDHPSTHPSHWPVDRRASTGSNSHQHILPHTDNSLKHAGVEDGMASTSDFVKKLYKMLEDQSVQQVVGWGPQGDCFVVKDMNEFTKSILPRMFKHSNFASFVRQLNKYDFHKVKNTDDNQYGEHSWTFRHPDFHADRRDALENIKRKVPTQRKSMNAGSRAMSTTPPGSYSSSGQVDALQGQVERLTQSHDEMSSHLRNLERSYQDILVEMVNFQRNMAQQDNLMQNLIQYFLNSENARTRRNGGPFNELPGPAISTPFSLPSPIGSQQRLEGPSSSSSLLQLGAGPRDESNRMSYTTGGGSQGSSTCAHVNDAGSSGQNNLASSRVWQAAANLGLLNSQEMSAAAAGTSPRSDKTFNRQEALTKLDALQKQQSSTSQILSSLYGMVGKGIQNVQQAVNATSGADASCSPHGLGEGSSSASTWGSTSGSSTLTPTTGLSPWPSDLSNSLAQNDLEVYTLGHLMPKSGFEGGSDQAGAWALDDGMGTGASGLGNLFDASTRAKGENGGSNFVPDAPVRNSAADANGQNGGSSSSTVQTKTELTSPGSSSQSKIRVRRTTIVPDWAIPPRVLLVDDDAVSRKLSSKFLQVFGCTIDVAVDGVGAVNKMNIEKYDLVLMDIVMPKLDGISATSIIRKFDHLTPIISMTSNSKPNEIMTYFSSGMNDILAKPFTKQGLLDVLEKHLMHLKVISAMAQIPRSVGVPPLSDSAFEHVLTTHAAAITNGTNGNSLTTTNANNNSNSNNSGANGTSGGNTNDNDGGIMLDITLSLDDGFMGMDDSRANPLASMGLSDDMYQAMIQNLISTGQFLDSIGSPAMCGGGGVTPDPGGLLGSKRPLDDPSESPGGKRSRFEVIE